MKQIGMKQIFNSVSIAAVAVLSLCHVQLTFAQLNTFEAGQPIRASEMNHNFEVVQEQIQEISTSSITDAGCSATQQENSVLIECSDGTSGVIAGAGRVVVYPEGLVGEAPPTEYDTGQIVAYDANDVVLGEVRLATSNGPLLYLDRDPDDVNDYRDGMLWLNDDAQTIVLTGTRNTGVWFLDDACQGSPFSQYKTQLIRYGNSYFVADFDQVGEQLLFKSYRRPAFQEYEAQDCISGDYVNTGYLTRPYTPAPEILNAAYPVRLEQLP